MDRDAAATDGAADSGPWSPGNLPGLSLWLNGDVGVDLGSMAPIQVTRWRDQSGHGLDFVPYGTGCSGVACNIMSYGPALANGHGAIACTGSSALVLAQGVTGTPLNFGTGDFAIAQVFMSTSILTESWFQPAGLSLGIDTSGNCAFDISGVGGVLIPQMNPNAWHALTARGAAMDLMTDWGQSATGPTNAGAVITTADGGAMLGLCLGADIAEVVAVKGKLSDADRTSLMAYLKAKYRL
jgi:hypothetical protein